MRRWRNRRYRDAGTIHALRGDREYVIFASKLPLLEKEPPHMTNDAKPGNEEPENREPLSATAMFFRSLDNAAETAERSGEIFAEGAEPPLRPISGRQNPSLPSESPSSRSSSKTGEFTQVFGKMPGQQVPAGEAGAGPKTLPQDRPGLSPGNTRAEEPPGEFTRIFLKETGVPPNRADEIISTKKSESSGRGKGFSSPGVSDAVSGDSTFTNFFKTNPGAKAASVPPLSAPAGRPMPFGTDLNTASRPAEATPRASAERFPAAGSDRSVTDILTNLSSDRPSSSGLRDPHVVPYREEPKRIFPPEPPSPQPAMEPGGVTQILNRLAPEPARPVIDAAPVRLEKAPKSGPGEFTRMISREELNAAIGAPAAAPSAPVASASVAPAAPPLPKFQPTAAPALHMPTVPAPPAAHFAAPAAPAMPAAAVPLPPKPVAPPAAAAAPKSKFEAMVPFLLLVNTFLLIVLLVVVIFLIKTR
jgi:hypothetical protein